MKVFSTTLMTCWIFLLFASLTYACDYCLLSQGLSPLQTTAGIGLRIDERYAVLDKMYKGTEKVDNPGNKETHLTTQVTGFYAITQDLTALLVAPYVKRTHKEYHTHMDEVELHEGEAAGLGDVFLMGRYIFYKRHELDSTTLLAGQLGLNFPTGATDKKDNRGEFMDAHAQPGTGSTDVLLGLNLSHAISRVTLTTNLLYSINNEGKTGDTRHQFGNWLAYDVTGIYRIYPATPPGPTVSLTLGVAGELRDKEKLDGVTQDGTDGHVVYLNTGFLFIPTPKWVVELNYRPAIYHDLPASPDGDAQMGESYKAILSLTHFFPGR